MPRSQITIAVTTILLGLTSINAQDLFPTYRDEDWEEEARNGVVSLSNNQGNYSINLSGFLILGMTLSAAVTTWAYIQAALERTKHHSAPYYSHEYTHGYGPSYSHSYENEVYFKENPSHNSRERLSPSSNSMNYTLNLSGFLMLGLGVAAATMFWAHASSLGRKKRSLDEEQDVSLPVMLFNIHRRFEEVEIREMACRQRIICEASNRESSTPSTFANAIYSLFSSVENDDLSKTQVEEDKIGKIYFSAWIQGRKGLKSCKAAYSECPLAVEKVENILVKSE